jgi:hypothetical protein
MFATTYNEININLSKGKTAVPFNGGKYHKQPHPQYQTLIVPQCPHSGYFLSTTPTPNFALAQSSANDCSGRCDHNYGPHKGNKAYNARPPYETRQPSY